MTDPARILLVDDDEDSRLAMTQTLAPLGHRIVAAASGEEALKASLRQDFALVLLDVVMPGGMDGLQTAGLLKRLDQTKDIPILFFTGMPRDVDCAFTGFATGGADYLAKPVAPWELRAKVGRLVDQRTEHWQMRAELGRLRHSDVELRAEIRALTDRFAQLEDRCRHTDPLAA
jgi:CheY-like chemotaxis protein